LRNTYDRRAPAAVVAVRIKLERPGIVERAVTVSADVPSSSNDPLL
jgi:hypothetical protein